MRGSIIYRRRRWALIKWGCAAVLAAVVFTPKLDNVQLPEFGLPLVSAAVAADE